MDWIYEPWPWYVAGPMLTFIMFLLIMMEKNFGMSANLRTICTMCGAGKANSFFKFDWKSKKWNLIVAIGAIIGGYIGANFLSNDIAVALNPDVIKDLHQYGIKSAGKAYLPIELFLSLIHI